MIAPPPGFIVWAQCATTILRIFPCLMAKVGMVAKKGKNNNKKIKKFKISSGSFREKSKDLEKSLKSE